MYAAVNLWTYLLEELLFIVIGSNLTSLKRFISDGHSSPLCRSNDDESPDVCHAVDVIICDVNDVIYDGNFDTFEPTLSGTKTIKLCLP